ncbi:hypothetical protein DM02DRAFT_661187 [Periconia macrospinosa]|uniref:Rhodopsin domain-containing protein n=1 Tax=Periconia macrospinosa TaxID=97972 RepID=A0A2V1D8B8_9PLEO|nr:hypothetical protein DM02DRAFT_661187 [Periconia macrospinosa]
MVCSSNFSLALPVCAGRLLFDVSIGGWCHVNNLLGFSISEVVNALLDLALVFVPVHSVMKLHLPMKEKIGVAAIFVIGAFIVVSSILRIIFGFTPVATNILGLQRLYFGQAYIWPSLFFRLPTPVPK